MGDFFGGLWGWATGKSISAALARTALLGYASRLIGGSTSSGDKATATPPDPGVRLQLNPSTDNQIPVLYGEAYFGGNITDAVLSADYKKMTYCLTLCEITGELLSTGNPSSYTFKNVYFNNNRVIFKADGVTVNYTLDSSGNQDISMRDLVKVYLYGNQVGLEPSGYSSTTPDPWTVMPGWTQSTHSMSSLIYAIVEVNYNKDKNVSGLPDCTFQIENSMSLAGDCIVDYMLNTTYGAGIDASEIDSSFVALNTFCSTGFTYTNTSNQSTTSSITINGLVDTTQTILSNIEEMAKASNSWVSYDILSGKWVSVINKTGTSVASFSDSNIIGDISISGTSLTQLNNAADVKYQNTDIQDKTDYVKISIPTGDLFANEPRSTIQLNLPYTNKQVVATKIGLQELKQARVDKIISFTADFSYINLRAGDLISVTSSILGYSSKLFRIITVTEVEGDLGDIQVKFTCLEYDAAVYDYSITQYNITTDNGILSIGSIGKPNTPTVTKTEQANVPKIVIGAVVPSGIVDAIEYWLTFDVGVGNDSARTYIQIGSSQNTDGSVLTEDAAVSYTYSGLGQGDFFIKCRGVNNVTTGPFSDPTGLIEYKPVVVADTVSDTPVSIGGQLMGLGLLTLLNNLDKLFGGDSTTGSVFDKIFSVFQEVTGVDLVGQASGGTLVVNSSGYIDTLSDVDTTTVEPTIGDNLAWDGENWVPDPASGNLCLLESITYYPGDRTSLKDALPQNDTDNAPVTGSYYMRINQSIYKPVTKGSGNIKLYKSNGTLVETVSAASLIIDNDLVEIPFGSRTAGTDYYILMDKGVITYNDCKTKAISKPSTWNFHTARSETSVAAFSPTSNSLADTPTGCGTLSVVNYITESQPYLGDLTHSKVFVQSYIGLEFNNNIVFGSTGTITIKSSGGSTYQTFNITQTFKSNKVSELFWIDGKTLWVNVTQDFTKATSYYLNITANCVKDTCGINGNAAITDSSTVAWTIDGGPSARTLNDNKQGSVGVTYDRAIKPSSSGTASIYDSNNNLIKTVPATDPGVRIQEG